MKNENYEWCKHIVEQLEAYAGGEYYNCPECGELIKFDNDQFDQENESYTCQCCKATFAEHELEPVSLYDYFDDVYDIEYRIGSDKQFRSVCIMVACGGPNIYIDTGSRRVELYWWSDRASYPIPGSVCDEIDSIWEEYFNC